MNSFGARVREALWRFKKNTKAQVIVLIIVLILIGGIIGIFLALKYSSPAQTNQTFNLNTSLNNNQSTATQRLLDGVEVSTSAEASVLPVAIMIENLVSTRPQSGLSQASVVYEALAEGGITRFMAIYPGAGEIEVIGPVRSARAYFVDWAIEYGGVYAHVGGSPEALTQLAENVNLVDLNQIGGDHLYFWRDGTVAAPHNLMTSSEKIAFAIRDFLGETPIASFEPWFFKLDVPRSERPKAEHSIQIDFSSDSYAVEWKYERKTNTYLRYNGGQQQVDALNNQELRAHTVVVQFLSTSLADAATGRLDMQTQGSGSAQVFLDGQQITAEWRKPDQNSRTRFYSTEGEEIQFNAGTIWVEVVPEESAVTVINP